MRKSASESEKTVYCFECGRELVINAKTGAIPAGMALGIKGYTKRYQHTGAMPWCLDCVVEMFEQLVSQYGDMTMALFYLCRTLDFPFLTNHINKEKDEPRDFLMEYLSGARRFGNRTVMMGFAAGDAIRERDIPIFVEAEVLDSPIIDFEATDEQNDKYVKWGRNSKYTLEDYDDLEQLYKTIASQSGIIIDEKTGRVADGVTDVAIIEAACNLHESRKARKMGRADDAKRYYELYDKAMAGQLLRGRDVKDKQMGAVLVQDIVKHCEQDGFIEPWDKKVKYPHRKDVVDQILLHIMNYVGKLCGDVFNIHAPRQNDLPPEYRLSGKEDNFAKEATDFDKQFKANMDAIKDFKSRQHFSDDEYNEDSVDTDADTDTDEALFGSVEE